MIADPDNDIVFTDDDGRLCRIISGDEAWRLMRDHVVRMLREPLNFTDAEPGSTVQAC
jgi:hypothetical protein